VTAPSLLRPVTSLRALTEQRAAASPDAEMLVDSSGQRVTFGEFQRRAAQAAAALEARGVGPGSPVSWQLPTAVDTFVLAAALARLGAVQNPVIPGYGARNLEFVTRQTGARLLIAAARWNGRDLGADARAVAAAVPGLQVLVLDGSAELPAALARGAFQPGGGDFQPAGAASGGAGRTHGAAGGGPARRTGARDEWAKLPVRWIFYTSGTTAEPKGARHTDASVCASAYSMASALGITSADRAGMVFPAAHIGGVGTWLGASLMTGCTLILDSAFDIKRTVDLLRRECITLAGAGTVFTQLYLDEQRAHPETRLFPDARLYTAGAAPRPPSMHEEVKQWLGGIGVLSGWGMTEAPISTMAAVTDPDEALATTEGRPCPGVSFKVTGPDGRELRPGEPGELRVRGPNVMRGYADEALNGSAFDEAGYLITGDLGFLDTAGYLTITGRLKDVIIRNGETVSARVVELELLTHPAVADAAVIGLPHPVQGELACAVVVPADPGQPPTLQDIARYLRGRGLSPVQWPEQLEIAADLPRNSTGKVLKDTLKARIALA
jgi:cyclohexanecarboxylate-CoA ligase